MFTFPRSPIIALGGVAINTTLTPLMMRTGAIVRIVIVAVSLYLLARRMKRVTGCGCTGMSRATSSGNCKP